MCDEVESRGGRCNDCVTPALNALLNHPKGHPTRYLAST